MREVTVLTHWQMVGGRPRSGRLRGTLVVPGLAVVDLGQAEPGMYWFVVQCGSGKPLLNRDLCRECAFAAAAVMAEVGGWDRPPHVISDDERAYLAVQRAAEFGPCYPPLPPLKIVGHVPGQPFTGSFLAQVRAPRPPHVGGYLN